VPIGDGADNMSKEFRIERYSAFLNNFEQWIDAIVREEDLSEGQLILRIKESYERSLKANMEHHTNLSKSFQENGEVKSARHHKMVANIYIALLK
jgi:hypothetical protein